ncbi:4-hydroxybutyrate CoA-transferase, partial [Pseudomonadota bacterium]|nr:4-hydroxybutyrate CoA-transferase [Pseudomonadota bacterium]
IIALPSTTRNGKCSKIVPSLADAVVTTPRYNVDYVVTEFGVARLRGASLRKRAQSLINIAHPEFREELEHSFFRK